MQAKVVSVCGLQIDLDWPVQVNLYVDTPKTDAKVTGDIDIFYCQEPPEINPDASQYARDNLSLFDRVIVSTDDLIGLSEKIIPFEYGTALVQAREHYPDQLSVSMVVGDKRKTDGHLLRHEVWNRQNEITTSKNFFVSQIGGHHVAWGETSPDPANPWEWPTLHETKEPLFDSMFHIAIENTRKRFWFTEKLIDCLLSKCIPIYWGCTNIADYFEVRGMLIAESADDVIRLANQITMKQYNEMLTYLEINQARALQYIDWPTRLSAFIAQRLSHA